MPRHICLTNKNKPVFVCTKSRFISLPYSKIQAYTVESAGPLSPEVELDLWFDTMGRVHFAFDANTDAAALCRTIASYAL